jgi:hypothetical protein
MAEMRGCEGSRVSEGNSMLSFVWRGSVVLVLAGLSFAETPQRISACKLKNDPAAYRQKLVEIEGFISHGFENFTFFDPNCPHSPDIWLEYGGTVASGTIYCCGPSAARSRPKELVVDGVPIPLVDDQRFRKFEKIIHDDADTVVHATLIGRFFPGERERDENGRPGNWGGYGHFGCCSLLAIQHVSSVDPHDRDDVDYRASTGQPDLDRLKCGTFQDLRPVASYRAMFDIQHRAEAGEESWVFDDPKRVALNFLERDAQIDGKDISGISEERGRGRVVYKWHPAEKPEAYMVVVSHPYWLSFYASDERKVAWVIVAAYKTCG